MPLKSGLPIKHGEVPSLLNECSIYLRWPLTYHVPRKRIIEETSNAVGATLERKINLFIFDAIGCLYMKMHREDALKPLSAVKFVHLISMDHLSLDDP